MRIQLQSPCLSANQFLGERERGIPEPLSSRFYRNALSGYPGGLIGGTGSFSIFSWR